MIYLKSNQLKFLSFTIVSEFEVILVNLNKFSRQLSTLNSKYFLLLRQEAILRRTGGSPTRITEVEKLIDQIELFLL